MAAPRTTLAIVISALLIAACFVAGFLMVWNNSPAPAPIASTSAPAEVEAATTSTTTPANLSLERLVIKKALYGSLPDGPSLDVTKLITDMTGKIALTVDVNNDNFGTDPAPGLHKKLRVDYAANGLPRTLTVPEGQTLKIRFKPGPARLVIRKAFYGDLPGGDKIDITEKVAQLATADALSVAATNDNFTDSAPGIVKKLQIDYTFDGKEKSKTVPEGETLTISPTD